MDRSTIISKVLYYNIAIICITFNLICVFAGRYSIVLLASCDSRYTFTMVDIGSYGSQSDGGIFRNCTFGKKLINNNLCVPKERILSNSNNTFPFYFIGDSAFPLLPNLMRPYPGKNLSQEKQYFNTRLSSARITIETTFGILANRWRIILNNIHATPEHADIIIKSIVVLHNYLKLNDTKYCPPVYEDRYENNSIIYGQWRDTETSLSSYRARTPSNRSSNNAFQLRDVLCTYINENKN